MDVHAEKRLVKRAKKLGLPTEPLLHAYRFRRIVKAPNEWMKRKVAIRQRRGNSQFTDFIDKERGYRLFGPNDIPGIGEAVAAAAEIYEKRRAHVDVSGASKPLNNIATRSDLEEYPAILDFAKSGPMMEAAGGYLGMMPTLRLLGVYLSPANDGMEKTQMFHTDPQDSRHVKCFVNVGKIDASNGPLTLIPADRSRAIRKKLRHHWNSGYLKDDELQGVCDLDDVIQVVGGPGYGAMVDTASCLHYGSRCRSSHRLVIMILYMRFPDVSLVTEEQLRTVRNAFGCVFPE